MLQIVIILAIICVFACTVKPVQRRMSSRTFRLLIIAAFLIYAAGYLYFTFFSRNPMQERHVELRPFMSYARIFSGSTEAGEEGVNGWLAQYFLVAGNPAQGIALNILLYVPLGYMLPLANTKLKCGGVIGIALAATAMTELMQLTTKLGWCELDDIIHNMLGALAGYLIYRRQFGKYRAGRHEKT